MVFYLLSSFNKKAPYDLAPGEAFEVFGVDAIFAPAGRNEEVMLRKINSEMLLKSIPTNLDGPSPINADGRILT
jgi:hypothetical protein